MTAVPPDPSDGGPGSSRELLPEVYDELRKLARARLARERHQNTLQPTALVHEAYLRVAGDGESRRWDRRGHFFAAAALAMRRILVDRARHHQRMKRGAGAERVDLDSGIAGADPRLTDLVAIDEALTQLEQTDPRKAQVVSLRYFAGLSVEETADALDISSATVKNEWKFARAWLYNALNPKVRLKPDPTETLTPDPTETVTPDATGTLKPHATDAVRLKPDPTGTLTPDRTETPKPDPTETLNSTVRLKPDTTGS